MRLNRSIVDAIWALAILLTNFMLVFAAVYFYASFIRPGEPQEFYEASAPGIASWTVPIGGGLLFFLVTFFRTRRNSIRNAFALAIATWVIYVILDIALGLLLSSGMSFMNLQLMFSLGIALLGALAGAQLSKPSQ